MTSKKKDNLKTQKFQIPMLFLKRVDLFLKNIPSAYWLVPQEASYSGNSNIQQQVHHCSHLYWPGHQPLINSTLPWCSYPWCQLHLQWQQNCCPDECQMSARWVPLTPMPSFTSGTMHSSFTGCRKWLHLNISSRWCNYPAQILLPTS